MVFQVQETERGFGNVDSLPHAAVSLHLKFVKKKKNWNVKPCFPRTVRMATPTSAVPGRTDLAKHHMAYCAKYETQNLL